MLPVPLVLTPTIKIGLCIERANEQNTGAKLYVPQPKAFKNSNPERKENKKQKTEQNNTKKKITPPCSAPPLCVAS